MKPRSSTRTAGARRAPASAGKTGIPRRHPAEREALAAEALATEAGAVGVEADDREAERIVARPDGFHWIARDGRQEFGPFESIEAAFADMTDADAEGALPQAETLQEAESELGIADWIDPDTGGPAEGQSPPHLDQE